MSDGLIFSSLHLIKVLPYSLWKQINERQFSNDQKPVDVNVEAGFEKASISISGSCFHDTIEPLRSVFSRQSGEAKNINIDLSAVTLTDGAFPGLCLILLKNLSRAGGTLPFSDLNMGVKRIFS